MLIDTSTELSQYSRLTRLMGNRFGITVVSTDAQEADFFIDAAIGEIRRIEDVLTTFKESSETNQINAAAGLHPVSVSEEVFQLIKRAQRISALTQGAFDISYGGTDKRLWNFDTQMQCLPDAQQAKAAVRKIDYRKVILDETERTVLLREKGMRIGFGGIGKGYAAEKAKRLLQKMGVASGVVNAAGDLAAWGKRPDGSAWTVGIADPNSKWLPFSHLDISDMAVATSGNYEKFVMIDGKRYAHTIDPRTGLPVEGIKSTTIICPNAEIADAMTTPVMIMGIRAGLDMINQMRDIACIIIDDNNTLFTSKNIRTIR